MVKFLTWDDMKSPEQYEQWLNNITDEVAQRHGYPNAEVMQLEDKLGQIADKWRTTKDSTLVEEYKAVLYRMIERGYNVNTLLIEDQLPVDLMPELPPADKAKSE